MPAQWDEYPADPGPDDLVEILRDLVHAHIEQPAGLTPDQSEAMVVAFDALDDWIAAGHPLPMVWQRAGTVPAPERATVVRTVHPSTDYLLNRAVTLGGYGLLNRES